MCVCTKIAIAANKVHFQKLQPELLSKLLGQLFHYGVTIILDSPKGGQVTVLLQHAAGTAVGAYCLSIGLQFQTFVQSCGEFKQKL